MYLSFTEPWSPSPKTAMHPTPRATCLPLSCSLQRRYSRLCCTITSIGPSLLAWGWGRRWYRPSIRRFVDIFYILISYKFDQLYQFCFVCYSFSIHVCYLSRLVFHSGPLLLILDLWHKPFCYFHKGVLNDFNSIHQIKKLKTNEVWIKYYHINVK